MNNSITRKIEYYLYDYELLDFKVDKLKIILSELDYNQSYEKWIRNKSSSLEKQAIENINLEKRISKIVKWKELIFEVLQEYERIDYLKYKYINLKYFRRVNSLKIKNLLNLDIKKQEDMKAEIMQHIFFVAIEKNMLKGVKY